MVIILTIFVSIFAHALNQAWPLLNLPLGSLTIIQFLAALLWCMIGFFAIVGFLFVIVWWIKNGLLFKPSKWTATWFLFGIIRWILISGLFYFLFLMSTPSTGSSIFTDSPWFGLIIFLLLSLGIYVKLTYMRAWWELRKLPPDSLNKIELDFGKYEFNFDPIAHKLALLRQNEWN